MQSQSVQHNNIPIIIYPKVKRKIIKKHNIKSNGCCFIVFGGVAVILGITLLMLQENVMSYIAEILLKLNSDSYVYNVWQKYPMEVPVKFIFFNWTNHENFFNNSVKPKLEEIGPYYFLQSIQRIDVVQNHNNNTITFKQALNFTYDNNFPNNGNLSDQLTTINYIAMVLGHVVRDWNSALKDLVSEFLFMVDPYYYFDTIIDDELEKGNKNLLMELSNYFDFILPEFPRYYDGFGWIKFRNGDPNFSGIFNIANGVNRQFELLNWNFHNTIPYFNNSCAKVKGSMGDVQSHPLNKKFIYVFAPELCRYLQLYFEKEVLVDGIPGHKYSFNKLSLDNGTLSPENKCFCGESCNMPSGLISISCRYNTNLFMSSPHFYNADESYLNAFEGLNPERHIHESYIIVEPKSLLCLKFKISAQVNSLIYPVEGISYFEDFPKLYFPLYWVEEEGQLPDEIKAYLNIYLKVPYAIISAGALLIILGVCLLVCALNKFQKFYLLRNWTKNNQDLVVKSEQVPLNQP